MTGRARFMSVMLGFAMLALLLAALGTYGVISYSVAERRKEIGIRMALGAAPSAISKAIVGQAVATIGGGIGLGLVVALGVTRLGASQLYGVTPQDP